MFKRFANDFQRHCKDSKLEINKDLKPLTTFKIGGRAKIFITINSFFDLSYMFLLLKKYNLKSFCLGGGSKILICSKVLNMVVYTLSGSFSKIERIGDSLFVGGGVKMATLCSYCSKHNLSCVEWGLGIPCSVGGGVYMNAGCFEKDFASIVKKVIYTDGKRIYSINQESCEFGYRKSFFQGKKLVILYVLLKVQKSKENILKLTLDNFERKKASQPYNYPSCGSIFKKAILPAPVFIQSFGLKGYKTKNAEVSTKHCGFIVNTKKANYKEVLKIIYKIKKTVWQKGAILLDNEIVLLGEKHGFFWRLSHPYNL